jgi:hypothetical protein
MTFGIASERRGTTDPINAYALTGLDAKSIDTVEFNIAPATSGVAIKPDIAFFRYIQSDSIAVFIRYNGTDRLAGRYQENGNQHQVMNTQR